MNVAAGPFLCIAAVAALALGAWLSQQRGQRRWRTPGDNETQLDTLPQSEAELDLAARQLVHSLDVSKPPSLCRCSQLLGLRKKPLQLVWLRDQSGQSLQLTLCGGRSLALGDCHQALRFLLGDDLGQDSWSSVGTP
jgi:hypothetical protein